VGIKDIRNLFSDALGSAGVCTKAWLNYERRDGQEVQLLSFDGTWADGTAFSTVSDPIPRNGILELAARATAEKLLKDR